MQNLQEGNQTKKLSIGEAASHLGISIDTLRRWDKAGKVKSFRSPGGHRYFEKDDLDKVFGKRYERYSTKKEEPIINESKDQFTPPVVEEKPVKETATPVETVQETTPVVEPINETPPQLAEEPVVAQTELESKVQPKSEPEPKPASSYAVVEQVDQPPPPAINSFENAQQNQVEPFIEKTPPQPDPEPTQLVPKSFPQTVPTLAPDEGAPNVTPQVQPQKENQVQEEKGSSKLKPIIIFLVVFAVIDVILLIVYFVTNRPLISPIS